MTFKPMNTREQRMHGPQKTLLYGHHGAGKTTQFSHYQKTYGKGFLISGEAGLRSVMFDEIDYLPFTTWDGVHDPEAGQYSFRGICRMMASKDFVAAGYNWVGIDSLTELGDVLYTHMEEVHKDNKNGFEKWGDYNAAMLGACRWIRDLPYHVLVTALAREETDDNGGGDYWPAVKGKATGKQLPGIFDNVLCLIRATDGDRDNPKVRRYVVTDEVRGWHGKVRDPRRRLKPVEVCDNITDLLERITMSDEQFAKLTAQPVKKDKPNE